MAFAVQCLVPGSVLCYGSAMPCPVLGQSSSYFRCAMSGTEIGAGAELLNQTPFNFDSAPSALGNSICTEGGRHSVARPKALLESSDTACVDSRPEGPHRPQRLHEMLSQLIRAPTIRDLSQ
eukprot:3549288-Rhodomonas_salina.3